VVCTPDGKTMALICSNRVGKGAKQTPGVRLTVWDVDTRRPGPDVSVDLAAAWPGGPKNVMALPVAAATSRNGRYLAATVGLAGANEARTSVRTRGVVLVWDVGTAREVFRRPSDEPLYAVAFDPNGRLVAGGGGPGGGRLCAWDMASGAEVLGWRGHARPILSLAFGPEGRMATGGADRVVKVWDTASGREILTLDGFDREVTHVAWTRTGAVVAATGIDRLAMLMTQGVPTDWPPAEVRIFRGPR
jgi:hypothetical protein